MTSARHARRLPPRSPQEVVTAELCARLRRIRSELFEELRRTHDDIDPRALVPCTQELLNRALFAGFAQDRGPLEAPIPEHTSLSSRARAWLEEVAQYGFRHELSVDVLGYVFEQSIADIEDLRAQAETGKRSKKRRNEATVRRKQGIFYTPPSVTRFLVRETLGRAFDEARARTRCEDRIASLQAYRDELSRLRVLDPACGSGALLTAAFDAFANEYGRVRRELQALGTPASSPFDPIGATLNNNLFGIDLQSESVEVTRLALRLKTPECASEIADSNLRVGNAVVSDPRVDPRALDWTHPDEVHARWRPGFDVVLGNPPYVRHELLGPYKEHFKHEFRVFDGVADLFVYFFERGIQVLAPGGRLGFIVSNKWLRGGYAGKLRALLAQQVTLDRVVDFGHAPIFADTDAFPCIIVLRKKMPERAHRVAVTKVPRTERHDARLSAYVDSHHFAIPQASLDPTGWMLEPPAVGKLMDKIRQAGVPLAELAGCKPYRGVVTGCNDAFLVDDATRSRLCKQDPRSKEILKRYVRGRDIKRWAPCWEGQWMIFTRRGIDIDAYPAIKRHLEPFRERLTPKPSHYEGTGWPGRKPGTYAWFEIQDAVDYHALFEKPKIVYQEIQFHAAYALDDSGLYANNKVFVLSNTDPWLLAVLNSPLLWWFAWRYLVHLKDDALSTAANKLQYLPIARDPGAQAAIVQPVEQVGSLTRANADATFALLDCLRMEFGVERPGNKLAHCASLTRDQFVEEVKKRRPKRGTWTKAQVGHVLEVYERDVVPIRRRAIEIGKLERAIASVVHRAYGLTAEEERLVWETAPPRMPVGRSDTSVGHGQGQTY